MDWSLVLASQGIDHRVDHDEVDGWTLSVSEIFNKKLLLLYYFYWFTINYEKITYLPRTFAGVN